jgi:sugar lactone lactonase YvrE
VNVKTRIATSVAAAVVCCCCLINPADAHPASGLVVDAKGQIFFVYSGHGVMQIQPDGGLSCIYPSRGGHWLCLDPEGSFSRTQPRYFRRISAGGTSPAIIFADGGAPIAVCRDGNLYYGSGVENPAESKPGGLTVARLTPDSKIAQFTPDLAKTFARINEGVTGLAPSADGSLYVASTSGVFKVAMTGNVTTVVHPVVVPDCDEDPPDHDASRHTPFLRGIAVDSDGTIYAPATSCHRVLKITPDGRVSVLLKSERPWSPTAVAVHGNDLFVLEYTNATGGPNEGEGWLPRVRKLDRDGKVTTLVTVTPADAAQRR